MAVYYSFQKTDKDNGQDDGLPGPDITPARSADSQSHGSRKP